MTSTRFPLASNLFLLAVIIKLQDIVHYIIYGANLRSFKCTEHKVQLLGEN